MPKSKTSESETRKHVFRSFNDRLSAIKIDPIRLKGKKWELAESETSYFITAFDHWRELNLTTNFTDFAYKCYPLCRSLPMILHKQNAIADCLYEHISAADKNSIEPLTDLLTKLARDLGADFEPHFAKAITVIIEVVSAHRSHPEVEVIESAFSCLAYLFKYLSRLLVADLKPTFDFLSPLFGKHGKQPGHILRFAAESLSFLIRRSSPEGLHDIVEHIFVALEENTNNTYYIKSLAILLSSTLKSSGNVLHSKTPALLNEMMSCASSKTDISSTLMADVLVDALHHCRSDTAEPLYHSCLEYLQHCYNCDFSFKILFVISGLRKGDRLTDWVPIYECLLANIKKASEYSANSILAISTIISTADFADTSKYFCRITSELQDSPIVLMKVYESIRQQNSQVFTTFVAGLGVQKLLDSSSDLEPLALFLTQAQSSFPAEKSFRLSSKSNKSAASDMLAFKKTESSLFNLWWRYHAFPKFIDLKASRSKLLFQVIDAKVTDDSYRGLQADLAGEIVSSMDLTDEELEKLFGSLVKLDMRKALLVALLSKVQEVSAERAVIYAKLVAPYTMSWDVGIRQAAVNLCAKLVPNELLNMCAIIDQIPQDLTNARSLAMRIRALVTKYTVTGSDEICDEVVPRFLFGILSSRFQPMWKEVLEVIPQVYEKCGERAWNLAYSWISNPPKAIDLFPLESLESTSGDHYYACVNLERLQHSIESIVAQFDSPVDSLKAIAAKNINLPDYGDLRTLALKSLNQVPRFAEAHGNLLIPYLLGKENSDDLSKVAYGDRTTLLELFSKFRKPTHFQRFNEIYEIYLHYLSSRHRPIQKLAVACVLSVNTKETDILRKYRHNLEGLTDDSQFKDELATFFAKKGSDRENSMHQEDRYMVMPIATRILYGHAKIVKSSTGGTKGTQRTAVLSALSNYFEPEYQRLFIEVATKDVAFDLEVSSIRRQQGLLSLLSDFIDEFQSQIKPTIEQIIPILVHEFSILRSYEMIESHEEDDITPGAIKAIRQSSTKSLGKLFTAVPQAAFWSSYFDQIYTILIEPKLSRIGKDNLEQPSALMNLFLILSSEPELASFLAVGDGAVITGLFSALSEEGIKEPVIKLIFTIAKNLLEHNVRELIPRFQDMVIVNMPTLLERNLSAQNVELLVAVLNDLSVREAGFSKNSLEKIIVAELTVFEKNTPLSPNIRAGLLETLELLLSNTLCPVEIIERAYITMARLFRQFSNARIRVSLAACFLAFSIKVPKFERVGKLLVELNSYDSRRLGQPDFDRRLAAFADINETLYSDIQPFEWNVLIYNMLFFMKDPEELSLRNNSVYSLKRFTTTYASHKGKVVFEDFKPLMDDILMPAVKLGMRDDNETFRELYVDVLANIVSDASDVVPDAAEMKVLEMDGDEEADFFKNIFHIQIHRRQRAVLRLANIAKSDKLGSTAISQYLIPLIEHFVSKTSAKSPEIDSLANESVQTIGALARYLTFNQFRALTRRYVNVCVGRPMDIRKNIKLVNAVGNSLEAFIGSDKVKPATLSKFSLDEVVTPLHKLMSIKTTNEKNLTERVTIAIPLVLFLKTLPADELELELPGKLTWLCQLLRAKAQELRDLVRNTLGKVSALLGTEYFMFVVKELKSALTRGPQLHVLGYTLHSLLVHLQPLIKHGDLNNCVPLMSSIIMEDIFGSIGEEKDSEGYITGAREIKAHKSYDSGFLITESISLSEFGALIMPVKEFLLEKKLSLKSERKVEDLLRRFSSGLRKNKDASTQTGVIAMYQLNEMCLKTKQDEEDRLQQLDTAEVANDRKAAKTRAAKESEEFFTVRLSSRNWDGISYGDSKHVGNLHLLQAFVLDALRIVLSAEGLLNPSNIKGLLPIIESGIRSTYEDVQISSLKLASFCLKVPMSDITDRALNIGRRALGLIKTTSSTSSELCQACLKLITVILRAVDEFKLKDSAYAYILDRIKPDIEEPERQSTTISFIRALLAAKVMIPELYEVMEKVSNVMITNQDTTIRSSCRSAYLRFLLDYPHGQARLDKYFAFLVSNLEYSTATGRLSVLEMIRMVVHKVHEDQTDTVLTSFFVGLVLVLVNDSDQQCRNAALQLLKDILARSDDTAKQVIVDFCLSWLSNLGHNDSLVRAAFEAACIMREQEGFMEAYPNLASKLDSTVDLILIGSQKGSEEESDWQLVYMALKYLGQTKNLEKMDLAESTLLYPHPWVRANSARLFGTYYSDLKRHNEVADCDKLTLQAKRFIRQLGAPQVPESHGTQVVKNLVFIAQAWLEDGTKITLKDGTEQDCVVYLVRKLSVSVRTDINADEFVGGKQAIVQLFAAFGQVLDIDRVRLIAPECVTALYLLIDQLRQDKSSLRDLAQEALDIFEKQLGTTEFLQLYNASRQLVDEKRRERKAKRSIEAVTQPEIHAKKKLRKNLAHRNARKRKTQDLKRQRTH